MLNDVAHTCSFNNGGFAVSSSQFVDGVSTVTTHHDVSGGRGPSTTKPCLKGNSIPS